MKKIGGFRRKTRGKFRKSIRRRSKLSISNYFQEFNNGDKVILSVEPSVQKGMYHPNYMRKAGIVAGKTGRCYEILIHDGNKEKTLIVHPVHLKRM